MLRAEPAAGDRGRSRFSKALPTPPPAFDAPPSFDASRPPSKQLPSVPSLPKILARKPVRKPVMPTQTVQVDKPLPVSHSQPEPPPQAHQPQSPPQLHSQPVKSPLPPPPPPMSIPRRPVLPPKAETPASLPPAAEPLKPDAPPASPTDSIGSLLSAYSRSSDGESVIRSSDGAGSQRYSAVTMSPQDEARGGKKDGLMSMGPVPHNNGMSKQQVQDGSRDAPVDKGLPPPPPAFKDTQRPFPPRKDSVRAPAVGGGGPPTTIAAASPPRDQLWRRRSGKSDRDMQIPDLKLTISHGSTAASVASAASAASQLPSHTTHAPQVPSKDTTVKPSQYQNTSHPGSQPSQTNSHSQSHAARAAPAPAPAPAPLQGATHSTTHASNTNVTHNSDNMGNEASKLKTKLSHLNLRDLRDIRSQHNQEHGNLTSMSDTVLDQMPRLPTPDYQSQDIQTPLVDGVVSPLSPAPSPHPPQEDQQAGSKPQSKPSIQRKAIGGRDLHGVKSLPQIRTQGPSNTDLETFPPLNSASAVRDFAASPSSPEHAVSAKPQNQQQQGFRPRTSSRSQQPQPIGLSQGPPMLREKRSQASSLRSPHPGMQPSPESRTFPELRVEDLPPPNPAALRFPATVVTPAAPGTVFPALPIRPSMVDCHQKHRIINRSRQRNYAVACQTCHKADREDRWKCIACELRMCDGCFHFMNGHGRDLNKLAEYLEANPGDMPAPPTPVAMQYPPRPGTGMSQYPSRPGTSMSQHAPRPGTGMSQRA
ncbi:hypothetical protein ACHAQA_001304 [Verticillium albo-atrum]